MSKKIIAGALGVATVVGSFAILAVPTFAATTAWHQVTVSPGTELILGGDTSTEITLAPTITSVDSDAAGAMTVKSTQPWKVQWQAVTGEYGDAETTAAAGTNLGTTGFAGSGGYAYAGSQTAASIGVNEWGAVLAVGGSGGSLTTTPTPTLTTSLSDAVTGTATSSATVTATYSAGTSGSLGTTEYYGTIYYVLSANP
jgi:hypothetical protein